MPWDRNQSVQCPGEATAARHHRPQPRDVLEQVPFSVLEALAILLAAGALFRLRSLSRQMERMQRRLDAVLPEREPPAATASPPGPPVESAEPRPERPAVSRPSLGQPAGLLGRLKPRGGKSVPAPASRAKPGWMVWLGGICVALAGVFLVKYSIEQGLLTPWARIALGTCTGFAMHALAEWAVRKTGRGHSALSALAAAASLTLCAAALAALHLYELVPPIAAFVFVAAVSMATMVLALRHGPVLAALGLIGCYAVPLLVGGDGGRIVEVMGYCLIVSTAVLLMIRYAYRAWLWRGVVAGSLFWWLLSTGQDAADGSRGIYLGLLGGALVFLPTVDWWPRLRAIAGTSAASGAAWEPLAAGASGLRAAAHTPLRSGLLLLVLAHGISIAVEPFTVRSAVGWVPLVFVLFVAARLGGRLAWLPWVSLGTQVIAWLGTGLAIEEFRLVWESSLDSGEAGLPLYAGCSAAVYTALACWNLRRAESAPIWISLAVASPVCWLAVAYALAADMAVSREWAVVAVGLGLLYTAAGWLLSRSRVRQVATWTILGCSASYSLAAAMLFRDAGLTLALAVQAVPLAWLAARHGTSNVTWMTKAVLAMLVARLTFNPWLPSYTEGSRWTLWTYGGSTLACMLASPVARPLPVLRRWIEAVAAHLLVLTCWAVTRDFLYDGEVFSGEYGLTEASINTSVWAALGLVYHWRSQVTEHIAGVFRWAARTLLVMSLASYASVVFPLNPVFTLEAVSATRIWNVLLLAYGTPALLAFLASRYYVRRGARVAGWVAAVALFVFVTIEIRHLWQGSLDAISPAYDGEMATYSLVWLSMAVVSVLAGGMRYGAGVYRGGMALLLLTVSKVFLVDMSGLTGLLRAASFMGLGLSLLGLAYLHQRFRQAGSGSGNHPL